MIIDASPSYVKLEEHNGLSKGDLLYVAYFDEKGDLDTDIVQISDFRKEFNYFYTTSKGSNNKYFEPEYKVSFISYVFKNFLHKLINKKTPLVSESFWISNVFFQNSELEAQAALLTFIDSNASTNARAKFELDYPGYLENFKNKMNVSIKFKRHDILEHFEDVYKAKMLEEAQKKVLSELMSQH